MYRTRSGYGCLNYFDFEVCLRADAGMRRCNCKLTTEFQQPISIDRDDSDQLDSRSVTIWLQICIMADQILNNMINFVLKFEIMETVFFFDVLKRLLVVFRKRFNNTTIRI